MIQVLSTHGMFGGRYDSFGKGAFKYRVIIKGGRGGVPIFSQNLAEGGGGVKNIFLRDKCTNFRLFINFMDYSEFKML